MLFLQSPHQDPFYHLAAEEFLLKHSGEDVFMLWRSDPVVVVGKHQNALAEINYRFTRIHNIQVARRLTGGGTVYHDPGNINFTFIRKGEPGKLIDFESFIAPIAEFLGTLGIEAIRGPKNEILFRGKKISGNAEHVYRNKVLHHGTLLFEADLDTLRESIQPGQGRFVDRAVQSNRSSIINLAGFLVPPIDVGGFCNRMMQYMVSQFGGGSLYTPGIAEQTAIHKLVHEKYATWEWIFGWSPDYTYHREVMLRNLSLQVELSVHRGIIVQCRLQSSNLPKSLLLTMETELYGRRHEESVIRHQLYRNGLAGKLNKKDFEELVFAFFG
jgi:lipoate-protein ligase A